MALVVSFSSKDTMKLLHIKKFENKSLYDENCCEKRYTTSCMISPSSDQFSDSSGSVHSVYKQVYFDYTVGTCKLLMLCLAKDIVCMQICWCKLEMYWNFVRLMKFHLALCICIMHVEIYQLECVCHETVLCYLLPATCTYHLVPFIT